MTYRRDDRARDRSRDRRDGPELGLLEDKSGAIMVLGLFMAVFLVGMLYYMVGIGDAVFYRERMQDASDAGAFSAAVMNARGMNLLTLLNIIMAVVLAVLIALKIIELIMAAALVITFAVNIVCFGCLSGLVGTLTNVQIQLRRLIQKVEQIVEKIIKAIHTAQKAIRAAWPLMSQYRAVDTMSLSETFKPPSIFGFVWPIWAELPTEDGSYDTTCNKAAEYIGDLIAWPFSFLPDPVGEKLQDWISSAVTSMIVAMKAYFCGTAGSTAPTLPSITEDYVLPSTDLSKACETGCDPATPSECAPCRTHPADSTQCLDAMRAACDAAGAEQTNAKPGSLGCTNAADPDACLGYANQARSQCKPASGKDFGNYSYAEEYRYRIFWQDTSSGSCQVQSAVPMGSELSNSARGVSVTQRVDSGGADAPCGASEWNTVTGEFENICDISEPSDSSPVPCSSLPASRAAALSQVNGGNRSEARRVQIVSEVYSCVETRETSFPPPTMSGAPSADAKKPPQKVKDDLEMGDEAFQLRAFAFGQATPSLGERGIAIATWGHEEEAGTFADTVAEVGRISIAQAEFYWAGSASDSRIEWMWQMSWRARLRRVRLPTNMSSLSSTCGEASSGGGSGGGGGGSSCGSISTFARGLLSVH